MRNVSSFKAQRRCRVERLRNAIREDEATVRETFASLRGSIAYARSMRDGAAEGGPLASIYAEEFARIVFSIPRERARIRDLRRRIRHWEAEWMDAA